MANKSDFILSLNLWVKDQMARRQIDSVAGYTERRMERAARNISLMNSSDNWSGGNVIAAANRPPASRIKPPNVDTKTKAFWGKNGVVAMMFKDAGKNFGGMIRTAFSNMHEVTDELFETAMQFKEIATSDILPDQYEKRMDIAVKTETYRQSKKWGDFGEQIGGRAGRVAGMAGGALYGAIKGQSLEQARQEKEIGENQWDYLQTKKRRIFDKSTRLSDWGYAGMMDRASSRQSKLGILGLQERRLLYGKGEFSIKNLKKRLDEMGEEKYINREGRILMGILREQQSKIDDIRMQKIQLQTNPILPWQEGSSFADEYSRKGLYVGAQVDVLDVNREILGQLKLQTELMKKAATNPMVTGVHTEIQTSYLR